MKKIGIFIILSCLLLSHNNMEAQKVRFGKYFEDATLRINYHRIGTKSYDTIEVVSCDRLPVWGGSTTQLIDPFDNGMFRVVVKDVRTGTVIYSRAYNTLFQEYRDTPEGETVAGTFEEVWRMPWPKQLVDICFEERGEDHQFHTQHVYQFDPYYPKGKRTKVKFGQSVKLVYNGNSHKKVDIVIIPEGYGVNDTAKMMVDLRRFCDHIFAHEPFKSRAKDFNVWGVITPAAESGITDPNKNIYVNSLIGASYNTFGADRYLMTQKLFMLHDAVGFTPCDHIIVMANSEKYGGGGIYNFYALCSLNGHSMMILPHELGHSIGGLADEYVDPDLSYGGIYDTPFEPNEPNITTLKHFDEKWKDLVEEGTPIPTPADETVPRNANGPVGAYEGAGYQAKGIYRPTMRCMMRDYAPFCPVCSRHLNAVFDLYCK